MTIEDRIRMANHIMSHSNNSVPAAQPRRRRFAWLSAVGLCGLCSCASINTPQAMNQTDLPFGSRPVAQHAAAPVRQAIPGRVRLPAGPVVLPQQFAQQPTLPRRAAPSSIKLASDETAIADQATERVALQARTPADCPDVFAAGPVLEDDGPSSVIYPDEYLFDGGDRDDPITRDLDQFRGLDTADTIAEFEDDNGQKKIKKTNRVAIYAPRFGSVVTIHGPNADTLVDKVHGHVASQGGVNLRNRAASSSQDQKVGTGRMDTRLRATGIGTEISSGSLDRGQHRGVGVAVMNLHESRSRLHDYQFDSKLPPHIALGMQFAEIWTRKQNPVIEGHATSASQGVKVQAQASFTGLEDRGKRGDLRLRKVADKGEAAIGDVITFTIYYENAGDKELKNVALIDNLTPRLEYLPEGTSTDRPGKVETEDNGEGSVILRFKLDEPLPGRTKGSITFQARVR